MTAIVVNQIKRSLDKNHRITETEARILFAHLDAQEKRIAELEKQLAEQKKQAVTE